ncbi:hypothetical protein SAMN05216552_103578 [Pseudoduganella namucuonensis]|uniref:Uncharacterized protein n=2 Tax=Pseudoduganella namucuonensis TaxID=1035707 RepID=A0A1I7LR32_9BURK|nr:hypothetical protein SAMN05216552_103578 [Pseudoduganella namucuonensis]
MALHTSRLALAQWQSTGSETMPQAAWHRTTQAQFLNWLSAGGFGGEEIGGPENDGPENENSGNDAAVLMPHCEAQCEELKFSRARISDAVE